MPLALSSAPTLSDPSSYRPFSTAPDARQPLPSIARLQLAFWSILIYTPIMLHDRPGDPFGGWTPMAAACAAIGAAGGVLVALSIKYADSILKTIATSGAIVLTTALNAAFLDGPWGLSIIAGAIMVVTAVFDYNDKGDPETRLSHAVDRLARNSASA